MKAHRWALGLALVAVAGCASSHPPQPMSVVWASPGRAYVASRDRGALTPGDSVEFVSRGRTIAAGQITSLAENELATVTIDRGNLGPSADLKHVSVRIHRAGVVAMDLLRVGVPSARRGTAFFRCARLDVRAPGPSGAFTTRDSGATTILMRDSSAALAAPWPRRLEARRFDDVADEEIALERGEVDVAVFWPGELSTRMREDPRWSDFGSNVWMRGAVVVQWTGYPNASLQAYAGEVFSKFIRQAFRGDLTPARLRDEPPGDDAFSPSPLDPDSVSTVRFEIDPRWPGRAGLQSELDRIAPSKRSVTPLHRAQLVYLDESFHEVTRDNRDLIDPQFTLGCPVVSRPELRRYVAALKPFVLANLMDCQVESTKP